MATFMSSSYQPSSHCVSTMRTPPLLPLCLYLHIHRLFRPSDPSLLPLLKAPAAQTRSKAAMRRPRLLRGDHESLTRFPIPRPTTSTSPPHQWMVMSVCNHSSTSKMYTSGTSRAPSRLSRCPQSTRQTGPICRVGFLVSLF